MSNELMRRRYARLHLSTGERFDAVTHIEMSELAFLRLLNRWNSQQHGVWQYWAL